MKLPSGESSHWYDPATGEARHYVTGRNGKLRPSTLRDARANGWVPSVTAITRCWPADALRQWLRAQDILSAATTPRLPEDTDEDWVARVIQSADEEAEQARATGARRHDLLHQFHWDAYVDTTSPDYPFLVPYLEWLREHVRHIHAAEFTVVHPEMGYGGTLDVLCTLNDGRSAIIDVKNRKKLAVYDTDAHQLVAYQKALGLEARLISIVLGTQRPGLLCHEWLGTEVPWRQFQLLLNLWKESKNYDPSAHLAESVLAT